MSRPIVRWFLVALLPLAIVATSLDAPRRTDQLRRSGLWSQLGEMQDQVRNGALEARAKEEARGAPPLEEDGFKKLTGAIERAFAPDRLREVVGQELAEALPAEDERAVLLWLDSDAGKRFTRLEEMSLKPDQVEEMQRNAKDALPGLSRERLELVKRFGDAVGAGEIDVALTRAAFDMGLALGGFTREPPKVKT